MDIQVSAHQPVRQYGSTAVLIASFLLAGCNDSQSAANLKAGHPQSTLLIPSAPKIDLGVVPQNGRREYAFVIQNPSDAPFEIDKIETSCDCLHLRVTRRVVPANGKTVAIMQLDLTHEKEPVGNLGIEVKGYAVDRRLAFALTVHVSALPEREFAEDGTGLE